jgi:hypothetical protein
MTDDPADDPGLDALERLAVAYRSGLLPDDPALADDWDIVAIRWQEILSRPGGD